MESKKSEKPKKGNEKKTENKGLSVRRFAVTYVFLMGAFFILIGLKPIQDIIDINGLYTRAVVIITSKVIGIMNIPCTHQGSLLNLPSITLDVKFGCNGLEAVMIYSVAVIAFPSTWKKKLLGIISGFLVIQIVNILRIAALAYSGIHFKAFFEYLHVYAAQGMMIAVSLGLFFVYLNYAKREEANPE